MRRQEKYKNLLKFVFSFIIWSILVLIWSGFWKNNYATITVIPFGCRGNWLVYSVYGLILYFCTSFYGGYRIGYYRKGDVIFSALLALIITNAISFLQILLIRRAGNVEEYRMVLVDGLITSIPFVQMTVIQIVVIILWATITHRIYIFTFPAHNMLLIYGGESSADHLAKKMLSRDEKYHIQDTVSIHEGIGTVMEKVKHYDAVVLCDLPPKLRNVLLKYCFQHAIRTYTTPNISDILLRGAVDINLFDTPLLLNHNQGLLLEQRIIKRIFDIVIAFISLIVAMPFMVIAAVAIKIYDGGPVLYTQKRLTKDGRIFDIYKFRSMVVDAEKHGATLAAQNDDRITPVGKIIRMIRFDELPQIWNIIKGDMSIVGPRPERPEIAAEYMKKMPEFQYRLKVKAGLTGYAQVIGRYNTSAYDKIKMDLMYISNYSIFEDIKLALMTLKILFVKSSSEGVEIRAFVPSEEDK